MYGTPPLNMASHGFSSAVSRRTVSGLRCDRGFPLPADSCHCSINAAGTRAYAAWRMIVLQQHTFCTCLDESSAIRPNNSGLTWAVIHDPSCGAACWVVERILA